MNAPTTETLGAEAEAFARKMKIPPCPEIAAKVMEESRAEDPDFRKIGAFITKDLTLSATILRTVNSPFYGLRQPVDSIQQALTMLGLKTVSNLVVGLLLRQAFPNLKSPGMRRFWDLSSKQAAISTFLANETRTVSRELAYTFALFNHCGMPVLRTQHADYETHLAGTSDTRGRELLELESNQFGVTHAQLGFLLARGWFMPVPTCQAILNGVAYPKADELRAEAIDPSMQLAAIATVADWIIDRLEQVERTVETADWAFALQQLNLDDTKAADLAKQAPEVLASASV